ncbi:MAG: 4-hydroxythreonine-4-phosphate dehydrogenase PdxA [Bacteroidales bacterium]|nr:4-hydroxythreonine-4-phosphate dehydrogenase PdxA [Bacteroidales bacterium]
MIQNKIVVGISHGDINGISYEVIIKSLMDSRIFDFCIPVVYGSAKVAAYHRKALNIANFSFNNIKTANEANIKRANIINCLDDNVRVELGKSTTIAGEASLISLENAVKDLKEGKIDVLVTAPINKENIQSEKFNFPGHTEYLTKESNSKESLMLMVSENLKVGVVTTHLPISQVPEAITEEAILGKLRIMNKSLIQDFKIRKPKIAVMGLNPHAGDNGLLGKEETEVIIPTIKKANEEGILALGPYPADGFFGSDNFKKFDAVLAMYHDQGLVPFKALAFDAGINYTAGLDFIRTSPGHGTAFEIAGMNKASEVSFRNALYLACDIYRNRKEYLEISKDPLKHSELSEKDSE